MVGLTVKEEENEKNITCTNFSTNKKLIMLTTNIYQ